MGSIEKNNICWPHPFPVVSLQLESCLVHAQNDRYPNKAILTKGLTFKIVVKVEAM